MSNEWAAAAASAAGGCLTPPRRHGEWKPRGRRWETSLAVLRRKPPFLCATLTALGVARRSADAVNLLRDAAREGVRLDIMLFGAAIGACEKSASWPEAIGILTEIKDYSLQANVVTYNAAISACSKGRSWAHALNMYKHMISSCVVLDNITYNAMMTAHVRGAHWEEALRLFNQMGFARIVPDLISHNAAIAALSIGQHPFAGTLSFLGTMRQSELSPDVVSYNTSITAAGKELNSQAAVALLYEMQYEEVSPTVTTINSLISACVLDWTLALSVFSCFQEHQLTPDNISYNAVLSAFAHISQWARALAIFAEMQSLDLPPDLLSHNLAIIACSQHEIAQPYAFALWDAMDSLALDKDALRHDPQTLGALLSCCEQRASLWERELHVLADLQTCVVGSAGLCVQHLRLAIAGHGAKALEWLNSDKPASLAMLFESF